MTTTDMTTVAETAQAILVAHQRRDIGSCLCGWAELGRSHPGHQVQMLAGAGVLADRIQQAFTEGR